MTNPNFFIVGAPRCGTTAMATYLKAHPAIAISSYKEPHFFGSDLRGERFTMYREKPQRYQALFKTKKDAAYVGEASVGYLFSKQAAQEIHAYNPDAKIIIMLRHPIDALLSMYRQAQFTGAGGDGTTLNLDEFPPDADVSTAQRLLTVEGVRYGEQVARYLQVFGREAVHIILYDDFKRSPADAYRQTLDFLGVDSTFQPESFDVINAGQQHRSTFLALLIRSRRLHQIGSHMPNVAIPVYRFFKQLNARPVAGKRGAAFVLEPAVCADLLARLRPDIEYLSTLIGRDLSHWMTCENKQN